MVNVKVGKAGNVAKTVTVDNEDSGTITFGEILTLAEVDANGGKIRTIKGTVEETDIWTQDVLTISVSAPKIDAGQ